MKASCSHRAQVLELLGRHAKLPFGSSKQSLWNSVLNIQGDLSSRVTLTVFSQPLTFSSLLEWDSSALVVGLMKNGRVNCQRTALEIFPCPLKSEGNALQRVGKGS